MLRRVMTTFCSMNACDMMDLHREEKDHQGAAKAYRNGGSSCCEAAYNRKRRRSSNSLSERSEGKSFGQAFVPGLPSQVRE